MSQGSLPFDGERRVVLDDRALGCTVTYLPGFLPPGEASALFALLHGQAPWQVEAPVMFGRVIEVRRRSCAFGEPGRVYRYSGQERPAHRWPRELSALLERLGSATGATFDYALANLYPDGLAALGWHADDEADLDPEAPIASVSLGAARDFSLRRGQGEKACASVTLEPGSLLVMAGRTQRHYQHQVPVRKRCHEARINLTFRRVLAQRPAPGGR